MALCVAPAPVVAAAEVRRDAVVAAVEKVMPCVVNIATETIVPTRDPLDSLFREFFDPYYRRRQPNTQYSLGSGVIIDEEGFVLTNYHVVARAGRVTVKLADGREFEAERIVGTTFTDVALLKIKTDKKERFNAVTFAADDDLLLGETVLALGNPFGLGVSVSRGILSSKSRRPPMENAPLDVPDWLQTDAAINPGNSGGPLINLNGDLIGINVAMYREAQGIGFAIPVKRVAAAISEMYSPEILGSIWFGARVRPSGLPLRVMSVQSDSPAGKAGLRAGDLILKVNGKAPTSFVAFVQELLDAREDLSLQVRQGSQNRTVHCRMVPEKTFFNADLIRRRTGVTVQELTPELGRAFGVGNLDGLLVADVDKGSPAAAASLQRGMIITSIDGQNTPNLVTAAKTIYAKAKGERAQFEVIVPRQHGPFMEYRQATASVSIR